MHPVIFETFYQQDLEPFFNSRSFFHVTHIEVLEPKHRNKKKERNATHGSTRRWSTDHPTVTIH